MLVCYVIGYTLSLMFGISESVLGIDIPVERINVSWELYEGMGLASNCKVIIVPMYTFKPSLKPDIVYSSCETPSPYAYKLAKEFNVPFVSQVISRPADYPDERWDEYKEVLNHADALVGVSPVVVRGLKETFPHIKVHHVPHGVNDKIADSIHSVNERKQFIMINVLMKHKRVEMVLEAFTRLNKNNLVIIGSGPEMTELEILNHIWCEPARFLGSVDDYAKFNEIKKSKALISASISEQFLIPAAEALYCRVPVISYNMVNVKEIYRDSIEYFETLEELMDLIEKYDSMSVEEILEIGEKGRQFIIDNGMTLTQRSKKLYDVLKEVVAWRS